MNARFKRWIRGHEDDPVWARPVLFVLLIVTAIAYSWSLADSGWANSYYSAAVQAGTKSWKAFLFGSLDANNAITVDKTPASLWPMEISARIFGLNSWSLLLPQVLEGVASVAILYATVRRWFGARAGLIAGAVLATTPVAALMFRFNNPDALLTLLLIASAYWMTRAIEDGRTKWMVLSGAAVGFAFLTKELQAFLVLPGLAAAYLACGPGTLWRRVRQGIAMAVSMLLAAGWWVAIIVLTPASSRPYVGGSQNNSFWNVLFGYNGFGRLTGNETGSVGGTPNGTGTGMWGETGWSRMFNDSFGGQASWLIPAALLALVAGLVYSARETRTSRTRAALIIWGGWLLVTGLAFSFGAGIIHEYYTVVLAPAIGATLVIGGAAVWSHRSTWLGRGTLATGVLLSAWWAVVLLDRTPDWQAWLKPTVIIAAVIAAVAFAAGPSLPKHLAPLGGSFGLIALLLVPTAYTLATVTQAASGAIPTAGPAGASRRAGPGGGAGRGGFPGGGTPTAAQLEQLQQLAANGGVGAPPTGAMPPGGFVPPSGGSFPGGPNMGNPPTGMGTANPAARYQGLGAGPGGGLINGATVSAATKAALLAGANGYTWAAAATTSMTAASYQLATDRPVLSIGGFNGTDPYPTLALFQQWVKDGKIHYFIAGGMGGGPAGGRPGAASGTTSAPATGAAPAADRATNAISTWVAENYELVTVGDDEMYDLTKPVG